MINFKKIQEEAKKMGDASRNLHTMFDSLGAILEQGKKQIENDPELMGKYANEINKAELSLKENKMKLNAELEKIKNL